MKPRTSFVARIALAVQIAGIAVFAFSYDSLDFRIYWLGGHVLTDGESLYREQLAAHWFTNTPFMALVFMPLAAVPLTVARVAWQLASAGAFAWACAETFRLVRRPTRNELVAVVVAGLMLQPMWQSLFLGQVNPFLLALVMTDVRRAADGRPCGVGIGLAAAVKLTPGVFVVMLLAAGKVRAALVAGGTFVVCEMAAFAVGPDASRLYWTEIFYDTSRVGVPYISNQSPYGSAARIMHGADEVGGWYGVVPLVAAVSGLCVAVLWARRGDWLCAAAVTGVTGLLVSPISWAHHWVWAVPALAVLLRDGDRVVAACGYVLFVVSPLWWTPHDGSSRQYGFHGPLTVVANCYLVAGVLFVGFMAYRLRRPNGTRGPFSGGSAELPIRTTVGCAGEKLGCF